MMPISSGKLFAHLQACETKLQADNLILWVFNEAENVLVASLSTSLSLPEEFKQPLERGLTSQCFLVGLPLLEANLSINPSHDPTFDKYSGKQVQSIMAAPTYLSHEPYGVLTAARFKGSQFQEEFSNQNLQELENMALQIQLASE